MRAKSVLTCRMVAVGTLLLSLVAFVVPSVVGAAVNNASRDSASAATGSLTGVNVFGGGSTSRGPSPLTAPTSGL